MSAGVVNAPSASLCVKCVRVRDTCAHLVNVVLGKRKIGFDELRDVAGEAAHEHSAVKTVILKCAMLRVLVDPRLHVKAALPLIIGKAPRGV